MFVIKTAIFIVWALFNASVILAQNDESDSDFPDPNIQVLPYKTPFCGYVDPSLECTIPCYEDFNCQNLGYNVSIYSCDCPAQYCPDGKIYGPPGYEETGPLTDEELKEAPHVKAACNGYVPAEIAPYHKQIGTCNNQ